MVFGLIGIVVLLFAGTAVHGQDMHTSAVAVMPVSISKLDLNAIQIAKMSRVISIELRDATIGDALHSIAKAGNLHLIYKESALQHEKRVTIDRERLTIIDALYEVLSGTNLRFHLMSSGYVVISSTSTGDHRSSIDSATTASNEEFLLEEVSGTVIDRATNAAIPGVNIVIKGTTIGTTTDLAGRYTINVRSLSDTLIFSFVGYQPQEIPLNGRALLNVELVEQTLIGGEVIVTALGLVRETRGLTYSTQTVDNSELSEARELNVVNSLQGRVAGMSINSDGSGVGAPARVILRGNRSISGDSQPLYVVDGVPVRGNPADINPDIIASISVLKGPNAAALYGSAAQNGVILISTKKAQAGSVNVTVNNTFMTQEPVQSITFQNEYGQGLGGNYIASSEESWGPRMEGQMVNHWSPDPALAGTTYPLTPQPTNVTDGFRKGYNMANNINVSMGSDRIQGVFSFTRTDAEGIVHGNDLERQNATLRMTSRPFDRLTLDGKIDYMRQVIDNPVSQGSNNYNPMFQLYRMPRNIRTEDVRNFEYYSPEGLNYQNFWNPGSTIGYNPYYVLNRAMSEASRERVILMTSLGYEIADGLSATVRASYDGANNSSGESLYRDFYARAPEGRFSESKSEFLQLNSDFLLSYSRPLFRDLHVNANFGGSIQKRRNSSLSSNTGVALLVPNFFALSNTLNPITNYDPGSPTETQSVYGFGQIGWRRAIFLDFTGRNDWSSTLPANNRSYFYPSFGLSAVLTDLIPGVPEIVSLARLRASYAQVGSSASFGRLNRSAVFLPGGNHGYLRISSTLPNVDLRPELTEAFEAGFDLRLLRGRLGLDATAYKTNTLNQLFSIALPVGSGASNYFTNGGDVENKGIELLLTTRPVQTRRALWEFDVNWATNRNTVISVHDERDRVDIGGDSFIRRYIIEEGKPFGEVYSRGFVRDDQGRVVVNSNGVPLSTGANAKRVANFNPDWTGGISSALTFGNITASFLIQHRQGGTVISASNAILSGDGHAAHTLEGREGGLIFGQNIFPHETAVYADGTPNTTEVSAQAFWRVVGGRNAPIGEAFVEDLTSTRLREATLGYNVPASMLTRVRLSNLRLSVVGRNLFFIYRASENLDPDFMEGTGTSSEGFQSFAPPTTRSFGLNVQMGF